MQTLETPRLILRSWSILDLVDFFSYASDPEIGPAAGWKPHVTREDTWEALRHNIQADDGWAIALRETGKVIGSIKLRPDPKRPASISVEQAVSNRIPLPRSPGSSSRCTSA